MLRLFYNLGFSIYYFVALIFSVFDTKAKLWFIGRKGVFTRMAQDISVNDKIVWFHCSSLGEFEQGRPLIETFKKQFPTYKILLTFFSPSGYEIRKNYQHADYIYYLPIDTRYNAKKFIRLANPQIVYFVKYEFYYNYLDQLHKNDIPVFLVSAHFRHDQLFFKSYGKWYKNFLFYFQHIFVQTGSSKQLLQEYGITNVTVTGDTRFDRVYMITREAEKIDLIERFKGNGQLLICGSTWEADEKIITTYINNADKETSIIFAPHEIDKTHIAKLKSMIKEEVVEWTNLSEDNVKNSRILIIDIIGILSKVYQYGDIAYIGGGFGKGIHNILEAATFGMPVVFGPRYINFNEAHELIESGGAFSFQSYEEFTSIMNNLLKSKSALKKHSDISKSYIFDKIGATQAILDLSKKSLKNLEM